MRSNDHLGWNIYRSPPYLAGKTHGVLLSFDHRCSEPSDKSAWIFQSSQTYRRAMDALSPFFGSHPLFLDPFQKDWNVNIYYIGNLYSSNFFGGYILTLYFRSYVRSKTRTPFLTSFSKKNHHGRLKNIIGPAKPRRGGPGQPTPRSSKQNTAKPKPQNKNRPAAQTAMWGWRMMIWRVS